MFGYLAEPADHSGYDYIAGKVDERSNELDDLLTEAGFPMWFSECINWDEVEAKLWDEVEEEIKNEMESQAVERWEAKQESQRY